MATMTGDPYLNHVPVLTGGVGREEVRRFYEQIFIGHWPADTTMERIPPDRRHPPGYRRTGAVLHPRHHHGPPASRRAAHGQAGTPGGVRGGRLPATASDPTSTSTGTRPRLLVQVGLLNPAGLPVTGAEQAEKLLSPRTIPANELLGPHWHTRLTPCRHRPRRKAISER